MTLFEKGLCQENSINILLLSTLINIFQQLYKMIEKYKYSLSIQMAH